MFKVIAYPGDEVNRKYNTQNLRHTATPRYHAHNLFWTFFWWLPWNDPSLCRNKSPKLAQDREKFTTKAQPSWAWLNLILRAHQTKLAAFHPVIWAGKQTRARREFMATATVTRAIYIQLHVEAEHIIEKAVLKRELWRRVLYLDSLSVR